MHKIQQQDSKIKVNKAQAQVQEAQNQVHLQPMQEEALQMMTVQPPLGMEMVVDPILIPMAPLVLILPMDLVLTPMLMVIHIAWMRRAIVPLQELMAHPAP